MRHTILGTIILGLSAVAFADEAPVGPDFDDAPAPPRRDINRELAASDGTRPIPPTDFVLFRHDSSELSQEGRDQIRTVARWLRQHPGQDIVVEGHTDASGTDTYNMNLASRRAATVADELMRVGIDPERLRVLVHGESQLASTAADAVNRRVVLYPTPRERAQIATR